MTILFGIVGRQPGAFAVAVKTWMRENGCPDALRLLATREMLRPDTRGDNLSTTLRLTRYLRSLGLDPQIDPISSSLGPTRDKSAAEVVAGFPNEADVIYCADPGAKFLVVSAAARLPPSALFLHADAGKLHVIQRGAVSERIDAWDLANLGLKEDNSDGVDQLLALHGLQPSESPRVDIAAECSASMPSWVRRRLRVSKIGNERRNEPFDFDLAYERGGWLRAIRKTDPPYKDSWQLIRVPHELNRLRPQLTVTLSPDPNPQTDGLALEWAMTRFKAAGCDAIQAPSLGSFLPEWLRDSSTPPTIAASLVGDLDAQGPTSGTAGALVTWMGPDPAATMAALQTHRPSTAWILYDAANADVRENCGRLRQVTTGTAIHFMKSDRLGVAFDSTQRPWPPDAVLNLTPGTKAQGCALLRQPGIPCVFLKGEKATTLDLKREWTYKSPPLKELLHVVTGQAPQLEARPLDSEARSFFKVLNGAITRAITRAISLGFPVPLAPLEECPELTSVLSASSATRDGCDVTVTHGGVRKSRRLDTEECDVVSPEGKTERRWKIKGTWLEEALVTAFLDAAERADDNVLWNVKPQMTAGTTTSAASEFDIVARIDDVIWIVECKARSNKKLNPSFVQDHARLLEGKALMAGGRFAIPLLVFTKFKRDSDVLDWLRDPALGAVVIPIVDALNPDRLRSRLRQIAQDRSTLGRDPDDVG